MIRPNNFAIVEKTGIHYEDTFFLFVKKSNHYVLSSTYMYQSTSNKVKGQVTQYHLFQKTFSLIKIIHYITDFPLKSDKNTQPIPAAADFKEIRNPCVSFVKDDLFNNRLHSKKSNVQGYFKKRILYLCCKQ